ncbi:MAG: hypothetical protein LBS86_06620 [Treponema sp.]|jgi:hypothetical protein|nr:hypothetical protein [Treponema sp.]
MAVLDRPVAEHTDKARRNAEYLAGLDRSFGQAEAGETYTFSLDDLKARAEGRCTEEELLAQAQ